LLYYKLNNLSEDTELQNEAPIAEKHIRIGAF